MFKKRAVSGNLETWRPADPTQVIFQEKDLGKAVGDATLKRMESMRGPLARLKCGASFCRPWPSKRPNEITVQVPLRRIKSGLLLILSKAIFC